MNRNRAIRQARAALRKFAEWDESAHPRSPGGSAEGGEFAPAGGRTGGRISGFSTVRRWSRRDLKQMAKTTTESAVLKSIASLETVVKDALAASDPRMAAVASDQQDNFNSLLRYMRGG